MSFGIEGKQQPHWSKEHLSLAMKKLQEAPPTFGKEGNTGEKEGKYTIMGYEVLKPEYDVFMEKLVALYGEVTDQKQTELGQAA